jgi:hypothetical protein
MVFQTNFFLQSCLIGSMNTLKKLHISAAIIDDDEAMQSMQLPNLRYLKLSQSGWVS